MDDFATAPEPETISNSFSFFFFVFWKTLAPSANVFRAFKGDQFGVTKNKASSAKLTKSSAKWGSGWVV